MNLLLRADASVAMGTGHVMRCLALAQAWQDAGGKAIFAMAQSTPGLQKRIASESCGIVSILAAGATLDDARQTAAAARNGGAQWIVVDGYHFDGAYQQALRDAGAKLLVVDDYGHAEKYAADVLLNQNVGASASLYGKLAQQTRLLLGPRYALLRREFTASRERGRVVSPLCRRLLVMMGGSDPGNCAARAIQAVALAGIEGIRATVVVGGANPHLAAVEKMAEHRGRQIHVIRDATNVAELMAAADVAISAAGSTCWELCYCGVPSLLIDVAENQTALAKELHRTGGAIHVGNGTVSAEILARELRRLCSDRKLRESLARCSRDLVDGKGAHRVVSVLRGASRIKLRPAVAGDCRILWEWANDPEVRAASFSPDWIPWEEHVRWFENKLADSKSRILIAENGCGDPVAQIRFDQRTNGDWEVDVTVASEMRGRGIASELIRGGTETVRKELPHATLHAFVKLSNAASLKAFERAAFKRLGIENVAGNSAVHLVREPGSE